MLKFFVKILYCRHYFSPLNTFMRKGKDPDPYYADPDPQHWNILALYIYRRYVPSFFKCYLTLLGDCGLID
jgi:hypothetical protein